MNKLSRLLTSANLASSAPSDLKELVDMISTALFGGIYYDKLSVINTGAGTQIYINLLTGSEIEGWGIDGVFTIRIGSDNNGSLPVSIAYTPPRIFSLVKADDLSFLLGSNGLPNLLLLVNPSLLSADYIRLAARVAGMSEEALLTAGIAAFWPEAESWLEVATAWLPSHTLPIPNGIDDFAIPAYIVEHLDVSQKLHDEFFNSVPEQRDNFNRLFSTKYVGDPLTILRDLFLPTLAFSAKVNFTLTINPGLLKPVPLSDAPLGLAFNVNGIDVHYSTRSTFQIGSSTRTVTWPSTDTKAEIGNTGFLIRFNKMLLDLSESETLPELQYLNLDPSFRGVFIDNAQIWLPNFLKKANNDPIEVVGDNLLIGSDGFAGMLKLSSTNTAVKFKLLKGDIQVQFDYFEAIFRESSPISSSIRGKLFIDFLTKHPPVTNPNTPTDLRNTEFLTFELDWRDTQDFILSLGYPQPVKKTIDIASVVKILLEGVLREFTISKVGSLYELYAAGSLVISSDSEVLKKFLKETRLTFWVKLDSDGNVDGGIDVGLGFADGFLFKQELFNELKLPLGPIQLLVGPMSLEAGWSASPPSNSNSSIDWFSALASNFSVNVIPPKSLTANINFSTVKGTGSIIASNDYQSFQGLLSLKVGGKVDVSVLALYENRNGVVSFLGFVQVEGFNPIPLGLGFQLIGVGGLIGINRDFNPDVIVAGLRTGAIDRLLFPTVNLESATPILETLDQVFPASRNRHSFTLAAKIGWGTPIDGIYALSLKLALVINVPTPIKIAVLGQGLVILPQSKSPIIQIRFAVIGQYIEERGLIKIDAEIYDSYILQVSMYGSMLARLSLNKPDFLLSAGGFHPDYKPPIELEANGQYNRMTLIVANYDYLKITATSYFAIAKNVAMFGNRTQIYAGFSGISIQGNIDFNALIIFDPFQFVIDFKANFRVKIGDRNIGSLSIGGGIEGPRPWVVRGYVSIDLWLFELSTDFRFSWPDVARKEKSDSITGTYNLIDALRLEIAKRNNYEIVLPYASLGQIKVKDHQPLSPASEIHYVDAFSQLSFTQSSVPLRTPLNIMGGRKAPEDNKSDYAVYILKAYVNNGLALSEVYKYQPIVDLSPLAHSTETLVTDRNKLTAAYTQPWNGLDKTQFFLRSILYDISDKPNNIHEAPNTYEQYPTGILVRNTNRTDGQNEDISFGHDQERTLNYRAFFFGKSGSEITGSGTLSSGFVFPPDPVSNSTENVSWDLLQSRSVTRSTLESIYKIEYDKVGTSLDVDVETSEKQYRIVYKRSHLPFAFNNQEVVGSYSEIQAVLNLIKTTDPIQYHSLMSIS